MQSYSFNCDLSPFTKRYTEKVFSSNDSDIDKIPFRTTLECRNRHFEINSKVQNGHWRQFLYFIIELSQLCVCKSAILCQKLSLFSLNLKTKT